MKLSWPRRCLTWLSAALLLAVLGTAAPQSLYGQGAQSPVFAIIDAQRVLRESSAVKSLSRYIENKKGTYQTELRKEEEALREADQELTRQRAILSAESYAQKREDLEQRVATLQREAQNRKKSLDQEFSKGMTKVQNELVIIAQEIAQELGLDLVLSKAVVVIVKPKFEITNEAIKRLNARLPEVSLEAPKQN